MSITRPANGPIRSASVLSSFTTRASGGSSDGRSEGSVRLDLPPGSTELALGAARVVRISVPGVPGMFIELTPRPKKKWIGGSTSTLFIQTATGDRHLRLDYGYNLRTRAVDYHWNVRKASRIFGVTDHTIATGFERALYEGAKYFNHAGALLIALGAVADLKSIVVARRRWRQTAVVSAGWLGSWRGCIHGGRYGATAGELFSPAGMMVGGIVGCATGAWIGGALAASMAGHAYDLVEEIYYEPLPQVQPPGNTGGGIAETR